MPFIHPHVALMRMRTWARARPSVPSSRRSGPVNPAAVGVDVGYGMIAVRTQLSAAQLPSNRRALREAVERAVPLSAGHYNDESVALEHARRRIEALEDAAAKAGFDPGEYAAHWRLCSSARWDRATTSSR